ncbi:helix-turn-helix domain-containing protein [Hornefia butyriciproducens]|uniref:helix-turn-helix domain-containing protein n=1 Tax=Hornefia butyriciproducens TaxID=2652293 RepID=UPI002A914401|nr:helix-turn-helix domain-containing protein [Hornefia butyriciproducens]MCI7413920.1 helix-turn-helix domain-containing protein [Clostridiales bacterium]MDY6212429.1 helix-turn-helix domain-containing protein [Hornefia butyriciproducens]
MVALQRDQYNPTSWILKYRAKHDKSFYLGQSSEIDPDVTDISYDPDSKVNTYTQEQKRLSDDEIRQIAVKYSAGASTYELAAEFGCHRSTISRALKKSGIEVSHEASKREELTKRVLEMYADFIRPIDIGKELGINVTTVRKILHENCVRIKGSAEYPKKGE